VADWWWVVVLVVLALAGALYLRSRRAGAGPNGGGRQVAGAGRPDFRQDREDSRVGGMSEEDRAWETASLRTDRETRERGEDPVDRRE
jgi:hypothetical protein